MATAGEIKTSNEVSKDMSVHSEQTKSKIWLIERMLKNWPHMDDEIGIKWAEENHKYMAYQVAVYMGLPDSYLTEFVDGSSAPDKLDTGWDRLWKHVYDPYLWEGWGGAPSACADKTQDAFVDVLIYGSYELAYWDLGQASHYLMDVGNPYHSNLWDFSSELKAKHDKYEEMVYYNWRNWDLNTTAYYAPKKTIADQRRLLEI